MLNTSRFNEKKLHDEQFMKRFEKKIFESLAGFEGFERKFLVSYVLMADLPISCLGALSLKSI